MGLRDPLASKTGSLSLDDSPNSKHLSAGQILGKCDERPGEGEQAGTLRTLTDPQETE